MHSSTGCAAFHVVPRPICAIDVQVTFTGKRTLCGRTVLQFGNQIETLQLKDNMVKNLKIRRLAGSEEADLREEDAD